MSNIIVFQKVPRFAAVFLAIRFDLACHLAGHLGRHPGDHLGKRSRECDTTNASELYQTYVLSNWFRAVLAVFLAIRFLLACHLAGHLGQHPGDHLGTHPFIKKGSHKQARSSRTSHVLDAQTLAESRKKWL